MLIACVPYPYHRRFSPLAVPVCLHWLRYATSRGRRLTAVPIDHIKHPGHTEEQCEALLVEQAQERLSRFANYCKNIGKACRD